MTTDQKIEPQAEKPQALIADFSQASQTSRTLDVFHILDKYISDVKFFPAEIKDGRRVAFKDDKNGSAVIEPIRTGLGMIMQEAWKAGQIKPHGLTWDEYKTKGGQEWTDKNRPAFDPPQNS